MTQKRKEKKKPKLFTMITIFILCLTGFSTTQAPVGMGWLDQPIYLAETSQIQIGYQIVGEGEPLLLLMGLGGTMAHWPEPFVEALAQHFSLIMMDNRGMGFSTDTEDAFSYEMLAEDALALLDALEIEKAHMLGYSMGSVFIQHLLVYHPERVGRAVLYGTSIDMTGVQEVIRQVANASLPDSGPVKKQLDIVDDWRSPIDMLKEISHDVLLIVGSEDNITPPRHSLEMVNMIENAWLARVRGYDHYLVFSNPEDFSRIVLSFLLSR